MNHELQPYLAVRVDPLDMVRFVQTLLLNPPDASAADAASSVAARQWGGDQRVARAAQLRWDALNRAFGDARVSFWNLSGRGDQIHIPAALIAAAGVAPLTVAANEIVFDIPTLLDATLELCEPLGHG